MHDENKQKLIDYCVKEGWGYTDAELIETVIECGKTVWTGEQERHRWYSMIPIVVEIEGMFISYDSCDVHGEEGTVEDCIGGYKLDDMREVFPKEVKKIVYVTADKL